MSILNTNYKLIQQDSLFENNHSSPNFLHKINVLISASDANRPYVDK